MPARPSDPPGWRSRSLVGAAATPWRRGVRGMPAPSLPARGIIVGDGDVAQLGMPVHRDTQDLQLIALPMMRKAERVADGIQDRKTALLRGDRRVHRGPVHVDLACWLRSGGTRPAPVGGELAGRSG